MTILAQAEQLRQQAIDLLLAERTLINDKLATLGFDGTGKPEAKKEATRKCGKCGSPEHNARRCTANLPETPRVNSSIA
jgi:hypothetical protein